MNKSLRQRRAWLDLALFSGAFLSLYGLISGYEEGCGIFTNCTLTVNNIPISFYQGLITYASLAIFISSIGLMSIGEAGSGGSFPSRHAILDFGFVTGAFLFSVGFGAYNSLCSEPCWSNWYEFGFPLMLVGIDAMGLSLYFLLKGYRVKGQHRMGWELLAIGSLVVLLVSTFMTSSGLAILPFVYDTSQQFVFVFACLAGIVAGVYGNRKSRKRELMPEQQAYEASIPKIESTIG
jgi:hypothetical protein